jgi:formiminotetrahydrofolate cyclodeaminase
MKDTTVEMIKKIRKLFVEMTFDETFAAKIPANICDDMDAYHLHHIEASLKELGPIKAEFIERMFADEMAFDTILAVVTLCVSTRSQLDDIITSKIIQESAFNALANATPKGNA